MKIGADIIIVLVIVAVQSVIYELPNDGILFMVVAYLAGLFNRW